MTTPVGESHPEHVKNVPFMNEHDGIHGRIPGQYEDIHERELAEIARARVEDREPDFKNLPATAGTPLITKDRQLAKGATAQSEPYPANAEPEVVAELPVDQTPTDLAASTRVDRSQQEMVNRENEQRNTALTSPDPAANTETAVTTAQETGTAENNPAVGASSETTTPEAQANVDALLNENPVVEEFRNAKE